jgi:mycothiol synthase
MKAPRPYRDEQDILAMQDVLVRGRMANNGSYYIHIGDLKWWLYYPPLEGDFWAHIHLWDDPKRPGKLLGWVLISPDWVGIDIYVQPELTGSELANEMYIWAEEEATMVARLQEHKTINVLWVRHADEVLKEHYAQRGFRLRKGMIHFSCTLEETFPAPVLPYAFTLRGCKGEPEAAARARAQYGAFNSSAPFERYLERFTRFMRSPVYQPEMDIVAVAPGGQIGAFCIVWNDLVNKVGLFEPVGTHPDFQRHGLGRAVMLEGLRRLQKSGMDSAIVSTYEDNRAGIKLYEGLGFQAIDLLGTYEKDV